MGAELSKAQETPPFSLDKPRYNGDTWLGRTLHFYSVNDPRTLLIGKAEREQAKELLERYKAGDLPEDKSSAPSDEELWKARRTLEATLHPDTGEPIFPLFRFSAFIPVNMVVVTATLTPMVIGSFPATAMIHFINQSYNAAINFANRNASNPIPTDLILQGYAGAVATAMSIGLTATYMTKRVAASGKAGGRAAGVIRATLPFLASSAAGSANVYLMRRGELIQGVDVFDEEGQRRGESVTAAKTGIAKCGLARVLWNIPIMAMPPVIMMQLEKLSALKRSPILRIATETAVVTSALVSAVSPALAIFPQRDRLPVEQLEPRFQGLKTQKHQYPVAYLYYNKGL